jgi:hypothetical protein
MYIRAVLTTVTMTDAARMLNNPARIPGANAIPRASATLDNAAPTS